jgi:hypothetical protein
VENCHHMPNSAMPEELPNPALSEELPNSAVPKELSNFSQREELPNPALPEDQTRGTKPSLALALAQGIRVSVWARSTNVAKRTAYRWSKDAKVRAAADAIRRRAVDRAVGRLAKHATKSAEAIIELGKSAESEAVRLSALRAVLSDMINVSKYTGLEERMAQIEEQLREQTGNAGRPG